LFICYATVPAGIEAKTEVKYCK